MSPNKRLVVVTRSFQPHAGHDAHRFDPKTFEERVQRPIGRLLLNNDSQLIKGIVVVVNTDQNHLGEKVDDGGCAPSTAAITGAFQHQVATGEITLVQCDDWGQNHGSTTALNLGDATARQMGATEILHWSPEIEIYPHQINAGLCHMEKHSLPVVGFLRQHWWERAQWNVVQNTAAIWSAELLQKLNGFDERCNGNPNETVTLPNGDKVPLAGMEDFHALIRALNIYPNFRWGMVGRAHPLIWNVDFPIGTERYRNHQNKVTRQYQVMQTWAAEIFPQLTFETVMEKLFACYHLD